MHIVLIVTFSIRPTVFVTGIYVPSKVLIVKLYGI